MAVILHGVRSSAGLKFKTFRCSPLTSTTQTHQSRAGCPQNSTWVSSEDASGTCCSCSPSRRVFQGQTACGKQCLQQRGFQPQALWLCCNRVIWYFPTWSASSPGQQDRDAAETSSFQRIIPGSGEVCNFWQSQDGLRKGKKNFSAPSPTPQPRKAQP